MTMYRLIFAIFAFIRYFTSQNTHFPHTKQLQVNENVTQAPNSNRKTSFLLGDLSRNAKSQEEVKLPTVLVSAARL